MVGRFWVGCTTICKYRSRKPVASLRVVIGLVELTAQLHKAQWMREQVAASETLPTDVADKLWLTGASEGRRASPWLTALSDW